MPVVKPVWLEDGRLYIIDQRLLPARQTTVEIRSAKEADEAIRTLAVRGAPAIGVAAAYAVYVAVKNSGSEDFRGETAKAVELLAKSRPTAYNLFYALERMKGSIEGAKDRAGALKLLESEAVRIHDEDLKRSEAMGRFGAEIVPEGARVLTHCNAGALATGGGGTALAVVFEAFRLGKLGQVWVDETRPLLQGARLTAWELTQAGIPFKLITDNAAGWTMSRGWIDCVVVGADRIAMNGDFANKIGTYSVAVLAKRHGIPFYTAAPLTTFDANCPDGDAIPIEERDPEETRGFAGVRTAPEGCGVFNPAFDVTPCDLVTGIITESGVIYPPYADNIQKIIGNRDGGFISR